MSNSTTRLGKYETGLTNGVPQGSTLAPILFDVFVESLTEELRAAGIDHQFYADDLVTIGDDSSAREAIRII